jgi:hypothetical protein
VGDISVVAMTSPLLRPVLHSVDLLDRSECGHLSEIWHDFSVYRPSSDPHRQYRPPIRKRPRAVPSPKSVPQGAKFEFRSSLSPRFDAGQNFVRTGGRFGRTEEKGTVARARTDYFREIYATRDLVFAPGIGFLMDHPRLVALAQGLFGLPVVEPILVYANLLLPGQELGLHTDIPEFRLAPGVIPPAWLRVVMCHSGLFERWRLAVATVIVYLGRDSHGGALAFFPEGAQGPAATIRPREGEAVALDADTIFHGVDRVGALEQAAPKVVPASKVIHLGEGRWSLERPDTSGPVEVSRYTSEELRFSASWKGCCFADAEERDRWDCHSDDLPTGTIIGTLTSELVARGRLAQDAEISNDDLGRLLVDEFVRFPAADPMGNPADR